MELSPDVINCPDAAPIRDSNRPHHHRRAKSRTPTDSGAAAPPCDDCPLYDRCKEMQAVCQA